MNYELYFTGQPKFLTNHLAIVCSAIGGSWATWQAYSQQIHSLLVIMRCQQEHTAHRKHIRVQWIQDAKTKPLSLHQPSQPGPSSEDWASAGLCLGKLKTPLPRENVPLAWNLSATRFHDVCKNIVNMSLPKKLPASLICRPRRKPNCS
jgi:hypothetical protein